MEAFMKQLNEEYQEALKDAIEEAEKEGADYYHCEGDIECIRQSTRNTIALACKIAEEAKKEREENQQTIQRVR